jgi:hypothetical protein
MFARLRRVAQARFDQRVRGLAEFVGGAGNRRARQPQAAKARRRS